MSEELVKPVGYLIKDHYGLMGSDYKAIEPISWGNAKRAMCDHEQNRTRNEPKFKLYAIVPWPLKNRKKK